MKREALSLPLALSFLADKVLLALTTEPGKGLQDTQRHQVLLEAKEFLSLAEKGKELVSKNLFDSTLVDAAHYYEVIFDTFSPPGESPEQNAVDTFLRNCVSVLDRLIDAQEVHANEKDILMTLFSKIRDYSNELLSKERTFERISRVGESVC